MKTYIFKMPLFCQSDKTGKNRYFNLNNFRNNHFMINNKMKVIYHEWVSSQALALDLQSIDEQVSVEFTLYRSDKRRVDKANPLSIHHKFFLDGLVHCGIIIDDNDKIVLDEKYNPTVWGADVGYVEIKLIMYDGKCTN